MNNKLSFRQFLMEITKDEEPPDLYQAASDELNTGGQIGMQVFDWVPFDDGLLRFGQTFQVVNNKDEDEDDDVIWIKPVAGKQRGDDEDKEPSSFELNVMKCARKDPNTGEIVQVKCPPLEDTKAFPIKKSKWRQMINKPFQQAGAGGTNIAAPGELPGM